MVDAAEHLLPNEKTVVELEGVVSGYTRWSGLGGTVAIISALTVPRVFHLNFWIGALSIVAVVSAIFMLVYYVVGRRLAAQGRPPSETPYVLVLLTDRRVLLLDRGLGGDAPVLLEETSAHNVGAVRYGAAGALVPQRLGYVLNGNERREFEFPRSQPVRTFARSFRIPKRCFIQRLVFEVLNRRRHDREWCA